MSASTTNADYAKIFGKNLSNIIYEKRITQAEIARVLQIPKGTVYNWTNGLRIPRPANMNKLCTYLQCTRKDLLDGPEETVPVNTIPTDLSVSGNMLFAALDACGYSNLRDLVAAAMSARQEEIDIATRILKSQHTEQ
jgi:transcriptional regulator with XRE-family HTH domain